MTRTRTRTEPTFPVIETFGATIQGEGALAGLPTHFVRFGGCDYRCSWCDSLYAVTPALVRAHGERLTADDIVDRIQALNGAPEWVTLSGGNPALFDLGPLVTKLHGHGYTVAVETQGSRWADWLDRVDCLTVSPKPPSSRMVSAAHDAETTTFMERASVDRVGGALKIVVFDDADFDWACEFMQRWSGWPRYLSAGTDPPGHEEPPLETLRRIADRYRWLCERVAPAAGLYNVRVLPQLHVVAWGHARAV